MKVALTVLALLGMVATANADISVEVDPGVNIGGGLMSYTVHLVGNTDAGKATAWDGQFDGVMNQVWAYGGMLQTPTLTGANAPGGGVDVAADTHFMFYDTELLVAITPQEQPGPGLVNGTLSGAFAFDPSVQSQDLVFAQIILPVGGEAVMSGLAADALGAKYDTDVVIPEPMTMSLLVLGGLALIRRRRA